MTAVKPNDKTRPDRPAVPSADGSAARTPAAATPASDTSGDPGLDAVFDMPGHLLRRCQQIAVAVFLDELDPHDLTPLQFVTLAALARSGLIEQVALAGMTALDRTTTAVVLKNLEDRGLVARHPSPTDRRSKLVGITPPGRTVLDAARPAVERAQQRMVSPLTMREREQFVRLLDKMARENNELSRAPRRVRARRGAED